MATQAGTGFPVLLTVSEVAEILRTTPKAIYTMVERAQLPGIMRIGRRILIRREPFLAWVSGPNTEGARVRRATDQS